MKKTVMYAERNRPLIPIFGYQSEAIKPTKQSAICDAVVDLAGKVNATAIVAETKSGATAVQISSSRSDEPLIAVTSQDRVANQLALVYGIKSYVRPDSKYAATKLTDWLSRENVLNKGDIVVTASGQHPGVVGSTDTIKVRVI